MRLLGLCAVALATAMWVAPSRTHAVCRVVEPTDDSGQEPVAFDPTTVTLFVRARDQIVDYHCRYGTRDLSGAYEPEPALPAFEAPLGFREIATGEEEPSFDPSACEGGAEADPIRDTLIHFVLQPSVYASGGSAGLIMPVPERADVHVAPDDLFARVSAMQRAIVEETVTFREDPSLGYQCSDPHYSYASVLDSILAAPLALYGCGETSSAGPYYRPGLDRYETESETNDGGVVTLERIPTTEDYEVTMLSASSLEALTIWLDENGFRHGEVDDAVFASYVKEGGWFMAVKVTPQELEGQHVALAPLVVTWRGDEIPITNRLQYEPGGGLLFTDAFVLSDARMNVEDGDAETLYAAPAAGDDDLVSQFGVSDAWLTRLHIVRRSGEEKEDSRLVDVAPEELRPSIERRTTVRIAAACCPDQAIPADEGVMRSFTETRTYVDGMPPEDDLFRTTPAPDAQYCPGGDAYTSPYGDHSYEGYYCAAAAGDARARQRIAGAAGWVPLLATFGILLWRRRRR